MTTSTTTRPRTRKPRRRTAGVIAATGAAALGLVGCPLLAHADDGGDELSARVIRGVQVYTCQAKDGSTSFAFDHPEALLQHGIRHFAGPRWRAPDGSQVVGSVVTHIPHPGAIDELVLTATSEGGPGVLSTVTTIRREDTRGGLAPAGPCTEGATLRVPYSATYVFVGAHHGRGGGDDPGS